MQTLIYKVNFAPEGIPTTVRLSQNENGRTLQFVFIGDRITIPDGSVVTISGTKPDGHVYSAEGTLDGEVATFDEEIQMTAAAGEWAAKLKVTHSGLTVATQRLWMIIDADTVLPGSVPSESELNGLVAEAQQYAENARSAAYGSPLTAALAADMLDTSRVYVYTGSETGMIFGHWYYYEDGEWEDGGVYQSQGVQTDTTLSIPGMPADAGAAGDALAGKVNAEVGKGLSSNDFTTAEKTKLAGIADQATRVLVDNTLKQSGQAADSKIVGDEIDGLKEDLGDLIAPEIIPDQVGYLKTNVDTVDINNPIKPGSGGWCYTVASCQAGDTFTVYGKYLGTAADLYTFTDSSYNVLERSEDSNIAKIYFPVAPENAAFVVFQKNTAIPNQFWEGIQIIKKVDILEEDVNSAQSDIADLQSDVGGLQSDVENLQSDVGELVPVELIPDTPGYIRTNTDVIDPTTIVGGAPFYHSIIACLPGDEFTISGKYLGESVDLYVFADASYNVLERGKRTSTSDTYYPVAPANTAYILIQKNTTDSNRFWKGISVINKIEQVNGEVEEIKDDVDEMSFLIQPFSQNLDGWGNKGIVPGTGTITSNNKRLLAEIPDTALSCYVDAGYSFLVFGWDGDTYLGWYDGSAWTKNAMVSRTDALDISEFSSYKLYAILIHGTSTDSAANIDVSEGIHFYTKNKTDSLLKTKNAPADGYAVGKFIDESDASIRSDIKTITANEILTPSVSGYIRTDGTSVDISNPTASTTIAHGVFPCEAGEAFTVKGTDPGSVAAYCTFVDSSYNILSRERGHADLAVINAPENSAYVLLQETSSPNYMFIRGKRVATELAEIVDILDNVDTLGGGYKSELYYTSDDSQDVITNYDALIAMYDALVTEYPNYITKNALTHGSFTNYEYVFSMGDRNAGNGQRAKDATAEKPLVLIMAGTHGHERCSIMGLYLFAKALCESPELSALRSGLVIKMIPVVCPSGYNNNSRVNANRVNINRNFDANWQLTPDDGMNYSGAAPADQDETQVVQAWMNANTDAAIEIDWHNSGFTNEICYFATCIGAGFAVDAKKGYFYGLDRIVGHWINDRGIADSNTIYGYTGVDSANGTSYAYAKSINLNGCLYETSWNVGSYGKDTPETIGVNAEAFCATMRGIMSKYINNL